MTQPGYFGELEARSRYWKALFVVLAVLTGCATPPPVKQAVTSVDQGYADNLEMMRQYRALVVQTNERYELWARYVRSRALLNIAVMWATTDPVAKETPERATSLIKIESDLLGPEVVKRVNEIRLKGLPPRPSSGEAVFTANEGRTTPDLIKALPGLVNAVNRKVDEDMKKEKEPGAKDLSGYDAYATNVSALRQINATIKSYLDIDVTVKPEDFNEIAQAIRELR